MRDELVRRDVEVVARGGAEVEHAPVDAEVVVEVAQGLDRRGVEAVLVGPLGGGALEEPGGEAPRLHARDLPRFRPGAHLASREPWTPASPCRRTSSPPPSGWRRSWAARTCSPRCSYGGATGRRRRRGRSWPRPTHTPCPPGPAWPTRRSGSSATPARASLCTATTTW